MSKSMQSVLIVDNEPIVAEELAEFLNDQGFDCRTCFSASEAIRLFHQDADIAVVLSDYRMPEMNGIELFQLLRKTAPKERVFESVLFTGHAEKEDVIEAMRAGVSDYFQKPLELDKLVVGVTRLMRRLEQRRKELNVRLINEKLLALSESMSELCQGISSLCDDDPSMAAAAATAGGSAAAVKRSVQGHGVSGFDKLSPRQVDVAGYIAKGLTNYQISCELGISENTVKLYVSQILRATGMHNRTQLALALDHQAPTSGQQASAQAV